MCTVARAVTWLNEAAFPESWDESSGLYRYCTDHGEKTSEPRRQLALSNRICTGQVTQTNPRAESGPSSSRIGVRIRHEAIIGHGGRRWQEI